MPLRVGVYVDAFNVYYGLFRGLNARPASEKWLNIVELAGQICRQRQYPPFIVNHLSYCTATVLNSDNDPNQSIRQEQYLAALRSLSPVVDIVMGQFEERTRKVKVFAPSQHFQRGFVTASVQGELLNETEIDVRMFDEWRINRRNVVQDTTVKVSMREEKGTDVNLAVCMLRDAALHRIELAIVLSNDSDLAHAIRITRQDFGVPVWVVSPQFRNPIKSGGTRSTRQDELMQASSGNYFLLNASFLAACQFPDEVQNSAGDVVARRPREWNVLDDPEIRKLERT